MTTNCPKCGANLLTAGFTVQSLRYFVYQLRRGRLRKVRSANSSIESVRCICGEMIPQTTVADLVEAKPNA